MRDKENILQLIKLPIDYIGFIFYEKSLRFIPDNYDISIASSIPNHIQKVGVFVNASETYIQEKIQNFGLDCIQLHGNESVDFCKQFYGKLTTIKAFGVDDKFDFSILQAYRTVCDYFLFDTKSSNHGGTGKKFDWNILQQYNNEKPIFLSGGIGNDDSQNIKELAWLRIHALDLNSRFEISPALKDVDLLKDFIDKLV